MSDPGKEDEQLLQDASTLLMFANVAAKQRQEHDAGSQKSPPFTQKPSLPHILDLMNPSDALQASYEQKRPLFLGSTLRLPPLMTHQQPPTGHHSQFPSTSGSVKSPTEPYGRIPGSISASHPQTQDTYGSRSHTQPQPALSQSPPTQDSERPSRAAYANIEPKPPKLSAPYRKFSGEHHNISLLLYKSPSPVSTVAFKTPTNNSPGNAKSPHAVHSPKAAIALDQSRSPGKSPGPSSMTFARGINVASGERNSDNAHIAAAALAAAADMPFPLRRDSFKKEIEDKPLQPSLKPAIETEEDAEKTEDELIKPPDLAEPSLSKKEPVVSTVTESKSVWNVPPLLAYRVDPDAGVIGCICGLEDDDGFTVQCDICFRWQHCICMGFFSSDEIPEDEYKCYYCDSSKWGTIDAAVCREDTMRRIDAERDDEGGAKGDGKPKRKQPLSDSAESKRRKTDKNKTNTPKSSDNKKQPREQPLSDSMPKPESKPVEISEDNDQVTEGKYAAPYQSVYYKLKSNDFKTPVVREWLAATTSKLDNALYDVRSITLREFKDLKLASILRTESFESAITDGNVVQVKTYAENAKQKFNGITRLGLYLSHSTFGEDSSEDQAEEKPANPVVIPENTPLIEFLGEIDKFENYKKDTINQYSVWGAPKPYVARVQYPVDGKNIDLVSDARFVGNEARFIRKSCPATSNCKIVPYHIKDTNASRFMILTSKSIELNLESPSEELRLPWEWDVQHPIQKMYRDENRPGLRFDQFNDVEKLVLISSVDNILNFVECGCSSFAPTETYNPSNDCTISRVKKATSYLLRSTRKASGISNVNITKAKDELVPRKPREFVPWKEKLIEREKGIRMELHITTGESSVGETDQADAIQPNGDHTENGGRKKQGISYHQHLLKEARSAHNRRKSTHADTGPIDIDNLPVPTSKELDAKFAESIKCLTKDESNVSKIQNAPVAKEETVTVPKVEDKAIAPEPVVVAKEERPAPPKVKKLSFADYKKKMK